MISRDWVVLCMLLAANISFATAVASAPSTTWTANFTAVVDLWVNATDFEKRLNDALNLQMNTTAVVLAEEFGHFNVTTSQFTASSGCSPSSSIALNATFCTVNFTFAFQGPNAEIAGVAFGLMNVTTAQAIGLYSVTIPTNDDVTTLSPSSTSVPMPPTTTSTPAPQTHSDNKSGSGINTTLVIVIPIAVGIVVLIIVMCYCAGRVARKMNHHAPLDEGSIPRDNSGRELQAVPTAAQAHTAALYVYDQHQQQHQPPLRHHDANKWPVQSQPAVVLPSPPLTFSDRMGSSMMTQSGAPTPELVHYSVGPSTPVARLPFHQSLAGHTDPMLPRGRPPQYPAVVSPVAALRQTGSTAPLTDYNLETSALTMYSNNATPPPSSPTLTANFSPSQLRHQQRMLRFAHAANPRIQ